MLCPTFSFGMGNPVQQKMATIAKLDGQNPSLVCVTVGGKIFIHTPQGDDELGGGVSNFLNLNKQITSIASGSYDQTQDLLFLASENTVIAYDVQMNSEKFHKEVQDGISYVEMGLISNQQKPLAFVGGNCSLLGYDDMAEEVYWNVTSDKVTCIAFADVDADDQNQMIVGCEDNQIMVFKGEEIIFEIIEASPAVVLCPGLNNRFCFGLENGMVGIYNQQKRVWRAQSQIKPISIHQGEFESKQGYNPLIIGRVNGQIELRNDASGEIVFKLVLGNNISKLIRYDFRKDGTQQYIAILADGQVKGFLLSAQQEVIGDLQVHQQSLAQHEEIEELMKKKNALISQQTMLNDVIKGVKQPGSEFSQGGSSLPRDLKIAYVFSHDLNKRCVELWAQSPQQTYIKGVLLLSDKLFGTSESLFHIQQQPSNNLHLPLPITKNTNEKIRGRLMVASTSQNQYYSTFELNLSLPQFSSFLFVQSFEEVGVNPPVSKLNVKIIERLPRFTQWISQCFIIDEQIIEDLESESPTEVAINFVHINSGLALAILINLSNGQMEIHTDSIELAGDVFQDLCHYFNINELATNGKFPVELTEFQAVLQTVDDYKNSRMAITADIAELVNSVQTLVVKAEDARIMNDIKYMRKMYTDVMGENRNLMLELEKRKKNNDILMQGLKSINSMINKAANLRIGTAKSQVTNLSRNAIQNNNLHALIHIFQNGTQY